MLYKDQLGRPITISKPPLRIVSLVPSITELVVDLGLEDQLVGVTKFCVHPHNLRRLKTVVGGTKIISVEKIKALSPDIIIANKEENTEEIVESCDAIAPVYVSDIASIADCLEMIDVFGTLFSRQSEASSIRETIQSVVANFTLKMKNFSTLKVAYLIWKKPYMAAGKDTFIDYLLQLNKFDNIILAHRYPEISTHCLRQADIVLLSTEPYPFKVQDKIDLESKIDRKVALVDGEYFSWYGSRLRKAFDYFWTLQKKLRT
ncbi:ABC transporter substrate-binding protein [Luteirhabdus pelagi]|uniref:ABC transporter substrate-binding protein n=1 Tax=Luteirhabdus pelagi TaxID=2792783 RepID=UPI00193984B0|nr:helical backbone metal receptor [Luteirhabdus pelagi]